MRRRLGLVLVLPLLVVVVTVIVQVQMARTAPRLEDEDGQRPAREPVRAGSDPLHVVWLGDSTTTGVGTDDFDESMAARVAAGLTEGPVVVTVLGVSGHQVHEVIDVQLPLLDTVADADVVLVSIGANDVTGLTRRSTFRGRYRAMVDVVEATLPEARVVLVGIPDMGTAPRIPQPLRQVTGVRAAQLDAEIETIARERRVHHVDLADRTSAIFSSDPDRYFSGDDFHPSGDGHGVWAEAVLASLASKP